MDTIDAVLETLNGDGWLLPHHRVPADPDGFTDPEAVAVHQE
jgi:hypothetical protein